MNESIIKRIEQLGTEASQLMRTRSEYEQIIVNIEIRLHQINGAIEELDKLTKEIPQ